MQTPTSLTPKLGLLAALLLSACSTPTTTLADHLTLENGDHIAFIGNGLGEEMQHQNQFESRLHQAFPDRQLVVRNLCVPGDTPSIRLRSLNFGSPDEHLGRVKADVVVLFFGFNESYRLKPGVDASLVLKDFRQELAATIKQLKTQQYNGSTAPRLALVSPIAFEDTGNPHLPNAAVRNAALGKITAAMKTVAQKHDIPFADVFHPTKDLFEQSDSVMTIDGAHLNEQGYAALGPILMQTLIGKTSPEPVNVQVKAEVDDKNFHYFNRYRVVNGYSIYGKRGEAGSDGTYRNREVMNRELTILDEMAANRDERIWALAAGKTVAPKVDDSNTLPFITPKTNVGGPDDVNAKRGKLGSLEYLTSDEQLKTFDLADGYQIQLVASEEKFPELANPVALNFDAKGRLWVSTMPSYPHWQPKSPMDDKVLIFEDDNGDYAADRCITFARGLHQPTGFELGDGGVYVGNQHNIVFIEDKDGDDHADELTRTICGFDTADSHHGLAAFDWGPGGQMYVQEGTFKFSQIEGPHGLTRLIEGGVWRFDPRSRDFGVHVNFAFANPWGFCFDHWGQDFIGDASPGKAYWAPPITARIDFPLKHPGGSQHRRVAGDQGYDDGDVQYPTFYPKRIRPLAGCAFLSSSHFPEDVQGNFLVTNVIGDRAVLSHRVSEENSGFVGEEVPMLVGGGDGNFRPVDIEIAPDGSLYVVDWHNALIGHLQHNLRDPSRDKSHGRIWRISHKSRPLVDAPVIADSPTSELVWQLTQPIALNNQRHAYRIRRELWSRPTSDVVAAAKQVAQKYSDNNSDEAQHHLLEALWLHQAHHVVNPTLLAEVLASSDHRARAAAVRVLSYWMNLAQWPADEVATLNMLKAGTHDQHPRVRLEAVRATTHAIGEEWALNIERDLIRVALSVLEQPMDGYLDYTLNEAMRRFEQVISQRQPFLSKPKQVAKAAGDGSVQLVADIVPGKAATTKTASPLRRMPVFLNVSADIIDYQLQRLSTADLLAVTRNATDEKFIPVHSAILARGQVSAADRQAALDALIALQDSDPADVILNVAQELNWEKSATLPQVRQAARGLSAMLLKLPEANLRSQHDQFIKSARRDSDPLAATSMAALLASGHSDEAYQIAQKSPASRIAFLSGVAMLPNEAIRIAQRDRVVEMIDGGEKDVVNEGLSTLATITSDWESTSRLCASYLNNSDHREAAVATLGTVPKSAIDTSTAKRIATVLTKVAEKTPKKNRTSDAFIDSMQLADRVLSKLPSSDAKLFRQRLREITVRLVRIRTVEEEMRYDVPYFAVQAGKTIQIVLENHDVMPHNLVFTTPGSLKEVANLGLAAGPRGGSQNNPYVPDSEDVLHATGLVASDKNAVLTFEAPSEPGEYPYVCTFPQHWYRMYGVMVVVEDLDAWNADPKKPADPIGNNRSFVKAWKSDDFEGDVVANLRGRTPEIGAKIFQEATCASCHQVAGQGGKIGPALDSVMTKWKNDPKELLREILHPSDRIEDKYAMHLVLTVDGETFSGLLVEENDDVVKLLANAEAKAPTEIAQDDIEEMVKTATSIMPKALMDQYTEDEIYELLAYLQSVGRGPVE